MDKALAEQTSATGPVEISGVTPEHFRAEVLANARPVVLRGLVASWPAVEAGRSGKSLAAYMKQFEAGPPVGAMFGSPAIRGRFHYNDDMSGFNFRRNPVKLSAALDLLLEYETEQAPPSLAVQSVPVREHLPGFEAQNPMPLLGDAVEPRVWIGNAVTVAAHHDPSENIACVVAGRRRFTLFPPDQIANLYMGPFELTPAGPTVSMVDFDAPDLARFPRFEEAMKHALVADLGPGDAIYIPYLWWHHVRSTERMNMLINYWWTPSDEGRGRPIDALMHAILSVRDLPPSHREGWRVLFDHYVFETHGPVADHIPPPRRGLMGRLDATVIKAVRSALARTLARP